MLSLFFFNDTATTEIYTLSLHDALPIWAGSSTAGTQVLKRWAASSAATSLARPGAAGPTRANKRPLSGESYFRARSEEHTSELQSRQYLVCRLLLEKKKNT